MAEATAENHSPWRARRVDGQDEAKRSRRKRETDLQILSGWIGEGARVLDLGCGRGVLLEHLRQTANVTGVGVDPDVQKIKSCVRRAVPAFQGDAEEILPTFPEGHFDWVVISRTLQELARPEEVLAASLRVGKRVAVGFANYGYWLNRLAIFRTGQLPQNEVFPLGWPQSRPTNPVTVRAFEAYCEQAGITIEHQHYLRGDWRRPVQWMPAWRAGYALYALKQG